MLSLHQEQIESVHGNHAGLPEITSSPAVPPCNMEGTVNAVSAENKEDPKAIQQIPGQQSEPHQHDQNGFLQTLVVTSLCEVMGEDSATAALMDQDAPLMSLGLTSGATVRLTSLLESRLGAQLPATLVRRGWMQQSEEIIWLCG